MVRAEMVVEHRSIPASSVSRREGSSSHLAKHYRVVLGSAGERKQG